jgi:hypothetical protein
LLRFAKWLSPIDSPRLNGFRFVAFHDLWLPAERGNLGAAAGAGLKFGFLAESNMKQRKTASCHIESLEVSFVAGDQISEWSGT